MGEGTENIVLEHLKRFQTRFDAIENKLDEMTRRLGNIELGMANGTRHLGHLESVDAQHQLTQDDFARRLARIERRLELS
jgi:septation ring formation regulator EzrA